MNNQISIEDAMYGRMNEYNPETSKHGDYSRAIHRYPYELQRLYPKADCPMWDVEDRFVRLDHAIEICDHQKRAHPAHLLRVVNKNIGAIVYEC